MGAGFLNPWLLGGLLALAVPVLVHLVRRQDSSGRGFPSLMFIRQIPHRVRQSRTLRDKTLLALRCLALTLLVLAFAGPYVTKPETSAAGAVTATVLLLDRSYSMSHARRWASAMRTATERINDMTAREKMALVVFDDEAMVVQDFTRDPVRLRDALATVQSRSRGTHFPTAFATAAEAIVESGAAQGGIVFISDLQRVGFKGADEIAIGQDLALELYPIDDPLGPNGVVVGVRDDGPPDGRPEATRLSVHLRNSGDGALTGSTLALDVDGRERFSQSLELAPGAERRFEIPITAASDRALRVRARVTPDLLSADDDYLLVIPPSRPVSVLLVDAPSRATIDGIFFEQALAAAGSFRLDRVDPEELNAAIANEAQVLVLNDVAPTAETVRSVLLPFLEQGGGILILTGDHSNSGLAGGWGPGARVERRGEAATVGSFQELHPLWRALGPEAAEGLSQTRIAVYRALAADNADEVLAQYDDGNPFLLERVFGTGRALVLTTTLAPEQSNLALQPLFVPLLRESLRYLAGAGSPPTSHVVGEIVDLARAAGVGAVVEAGDVVVESPSGTETRLLAEAALFRALEPGFHEVHAAAGTSWPSVFAVNAERTESMLGALTIAEFQQRMVRTGSTGAAVVAALPSSQVSQSNLWWNLLLCAGLLLLLESALANRLSSRRVGVARAPGSPVR